MVSSLVLLTNAHELELARFVASQGMPHDDCWHPLHSSKSASNSRAARWHDGVQRRAAHTLVVSAGRGVPHPAQLRE